MTEKKSNKGMGKLDLSRRHVLMLTGATAVMAPVFWKQAWAAEKDQPQMADSSAIKVYGSELQIEAYRALMEVLGASAIIATGSPGAVLQGKMESSYRNGLILTFGGGTNEVQRDIIAMAGMGMPNYKD